LEFNLPADDDDPKSPTQVVSVARGKYGKKGNHMQATRLLALAAVFTAFSGGLTGTPIEAIQANELTAVITTTKGDIQVTLFPAEAPLTVANFVNLAQRGYYDGLKFHRVLANFMIQGGDPTGTGSGGPGYRFADEFSPSLRHDSAGTLSMANSGPSTNGSQFFITHGPTSHLDDIHSIFGKVSSGQDVVDAIAQDDVMTTIVIEGDPSSLLAAQKEQVDEWNTILDRR
jgi:peptidyl-prolyl cis-trans isomerase B (cyclophilin B)